MPGRIRVLVIRVHWEMKIWMRRHLLVGASIVRLFLHDQSQLLSVLSYLIDLKYGIRRLPQIRYETL